MDNVTAGAILGPIEFHAAGSFGVINAGQVGVIHTVAGPASAFPPVQLLVPLSNIGPVFDGNGLDP
jgi:hypothetical protein